MLPAIGFLVRLSRPRTAETRKVFPALGTIATIVLETSPSTDVQALFRGADSLLCLIESETGRFPGQGVYELNERGSASLSELNPHLLRLLAVSDSLHEATGGLFDPTAGALVETWGFPHNPVVPESSAIAAALLVTGWNAVVFRNDSIILPEGAKLDFGAVAKGYAVDMVYEYLFSRGVLSCLVEIGGEVRCGGERLWRVAVRHPRNEAYIAVYEMDSGALATSGDYESFLIDDGVWYSHLIDPRTGYPGRGSLSATVYAGTCGAADAFATAAAIGGPSGLQGFAMGDVLGILFAVQNEEGEVATWSTGVLPNTR